MSHLPHRTLTPHQKKIRLVHILPEHQTPSLQDFTNADRGGCPSPDPGSFVACTISHVSLDDTPSYTALSYSWGDASLTTPILIDGCIFQVTTNLEAALRRLRRSDTTLALWVDALCIDQGNDMEKSEQLEYMRPIYSQALSVVTWLGPSADDSDIAMQWIDDYGTRACELGIGTKPELQLRHILESFKEQEKSSIGTNLGAFIHDLREELTAAKPKTFVLLCALDALFKRPYWSRIWVVQELASASNAVIVCGERRVSERALHYALRLVRNYRQHQILVYGLDVPIPNPGRMSIVSLRPSRPILLLKARRSVKLSPLMYLLRNFRSFEATDPRDKVFALYGIAGDIEVHGFRPDYSKSCEDVFTDLARALIQNGYMELLSLCEFPKKITDIPSWAPDWSCGVYRSPLQQRMLDRSAETPLTKLEPKFSTSGEFKKTQPKVLEAIGRNMPLLLSGLFLGNVQSLGRSWESEYVISTWLTDLHTLCPGISDVIKPTTRQAMAVWRTAVADQEIRQGIRKPRLSEEKLAFLEDKLKDEDPSNIDEQKLIDLGLGEYCHQISDVARGRRPLCVSGTYLGIGPSETELGDSLFVLLGGEVPYIMRRNNEDKKWRLVGEAYVHGIMDGEILEQSQVVETVAVF
ncbi:heterokaryon incompatibility protein [Phlyctema vagabunda]|uniref:Heterokaryon incompatibility protein n=1 Tax=Phlyctema vagabunda TaxID=108571 RepID=A0ABR4P844_9HELO